MSSQTTLEITEAVTDVVATGDTISINLTDDITKIQAYTLAIPFEVPGQITSANVTVVPYNTITATNLTDALKQLADQDFRSATAPSGTNVSEGDTWYDINNNVMKVYREISSGVFAWTNLIVAETNDSLDAGAF